GIDGVRVPAMDVLVGPRADARNDHQVDLARMVGAVALEELQGTVHAAGLITVHATGDEDGRQRVVPVARTHDDQRIGIGGVVEAAVFGDVETLAQAIDPREHVVGIAAMAHLAGQPGVLFGIAPRLVGRADGVWGRCVHWRSSMHRGNRESSKDATNKPPQRNQPTPLRPTRIGRSDGDCSTPGAWYSKRTSRMPLGTVGWIGSAPVQPL